MAANRLQMNPAKTELLWAGSKHNISMLGSHAPALQLGSDTVTASDHVRVLGVMFSSDLSLEKHVSKTRAVSYVYRCFHGQAPRYLADHLITSSDVASRLRLRSANRHQLIVPRCRLNTYGRRAFSIAGPMVWNSLPDEVRDPACGSDSFKQFLKTILFSLY